MPIGSGKGGVKLWWELQSDLNITTTPVIQNTWYTILDTTEDIEIQSIHLKQTNDEAAVKDVEFRVTIDGMTKVGTYNQGHAGLYKWIKDYQTDNFAVNLTVYILSAYYETIIGHSVKLEYRITSIAGTNQTLYAYIVYELLRAT